VVFVSAFADSKTLERARLSGAFGFVTKPIEGKQLNAAILMALEKSYEVSVSSRMPRD
jgi:FixJ family two-component response regulator